MSGKPRTWKKRGGITPIITQECLWRGTVNAISQGEATGKARGPFLSIEATASLAAKERTGKAGVRARRGRGVLVGCCPLGPLDSRPLFAMQCLNCSGTSAQPVP